VTFDTWEGGIQALFWASGVQFPGVVAAGGKSRANCIQRPEVVLGSHGHKERLGSNIALRVCRHLVGDRNRGGGPSLRLGERANFCFCPGRQFLIVCHPDLHSMSADSFGDGIAAVGGDLPAIAQTPSFLADI
jgi:hypothetical protein